MIKAVMNKDGPGQPIVLLGLSAGNVMRLKEGHPIRVKGSEVGGIPLDILITYGDTEMDIVRDLKDAGLRLPDVPHIGGVQG